MKVKMQAHKCILLDQAAREAGRIQSLLERDFRFFWTFAYLSLVNEAHNTSNSLFPHQDTDLLSSTPSDTFFCQLIMAKSIVSLPKTTLCLTPGKDWFISLLKRGNILSPTLLDFTLCIYLWLLNTELLRGGKGMHPRSVLPHRCKKSTLCRKIYFQTLSLRVEWTGSIYLQPESEYRTS